MEGEGSAQKPNASVEAVAETAEAEELKTPSEGAPERREEEEATTRSEKKEKEKEDKPRSLAAFKVLVYSVSVYTVFFVCLFFFLSKNEKFYWVFLIYSLVLPKLMFKVIFIGGFKL